MQVIRTFVVAGAVSGAGVMIHAQAAPKADPQMQAVLDQPAKPGPKPLEKSSPEEARKQPSPADAVTALLKAQGKSTALEPVGKVEDRSVAELSVP